MEDIDVMCDVVLVFRVWLYIVNFVVLFKFWLIILKVYLIMCI